MGEIFPACNSTKPRRHDAAITSLVFHPDGRSFASSDADGWIKGWDWPTCACRWKVHAGLGALHQLAWHADGEQLAATGERGVELRSSPFVAEPLWRRAHAVRSTGSVAFGPDFLAIGADGGGIALCDLKTGQPRSTLPGHRNSVTALAYLSAERLLASAGHDQSVRLWDVAAGKERSLWRFDGPAPTWLAFAPRGDVLVSGGASMSTILWDPKRTVPFCHIVPARDVCAVFTPRGGDLLLGSAVNGSVRIGSPQRWEKARLTVASDAAVGAPRLDVYDWVVPGGHLELVWGNAASADGRWFATASHDRTVRIWDARTSRLVHTLEGHAGIVWTVAFSADSRYLASGSADADRGEIKLWDVASGKEVKHMAGHKRLVVGLAFHPTAPLLVSASFDGSLLGWEVPSGKALGLLHQFDQAVHQLAMHPQGHWLAAACHDHHVALWDFRQGKFSPRAPDKALAGHGHSVWAVTFSSGGDTLASASENGLIILWDGESHEQRLRLRNTSTRVRSLTFSHDARLLAAGCLQERAILWDLDRVRRTLKEMNLDW